jgi:hypothetical protein
MRSTQVVRKAELELRVFTLERTGQGNLEADPVFVELSERARTASMELRELQSLILLGTYRVQGSLENKAFTPLGNPADEEVTSRLIIPEKFRSPNGTGNTSHPPIKISSSLHFFERGYSRGSDSTWRLDQAGFPANM